MLQYWPQVEGGKVRSETRFGRYVAVVKSDLQSLGEVEYLYVMAVFKMPQKKLCLCVASEVNTFAREMALKDLPDDPILGVFPGDAHRNLGASSDWGDIDRLGRHRQIHGQGLRNRANPS